MNTRNYEDELKVAAEGGNIDHLYAVIEQDEFVLDRIDSKPFVQTPLHLAAYAGNLEFAIEVMRLKPSYAYKLNQQGFSPIHLAMQRLQELIINQQGSDPIQLAIQKRKIMTMVRCLVETDKDIVRVKGREGITPLHFATQIGEINLLAAFIYVCPNSIGDVNVRDETALHLAVKYNQYDALQVLVGCFKFEMIHEKVAKHLASNTLNWKDNEGNTVLHISTLSTDSRALQLLVKTRIYLDARNLNNLTALDMVATTNAEMKSILSTAGAKPSSTVAYAPMLAQTIKSNLTFMETISVGIIRIRNSMPEEQRNTFLLGATLVATSIYQSSLSPPGGFYGDNNEITNTTISKNSTMRASQTNLGKSVLSGSSFLFFLLWNTISLLCSTFAIFLMTPLNWMEGFLFAPLVLFVCGYVSNMSFISPTSATQSFNYILFIALVSYYLFGLFYSYYASNRRIRLWL